MFQKLSGLLTDFVDKFRRAAQMLSIVGRSRLRPMVELSGTLFQLNLIIISMLYIIGHSKCVEDL